MHKPILPTEEKNLLLSNSRKTKQSQMIMGKPALYPDPGYRMISPKHDEKPDVLQAAIQSAGLLRTPQGGFANWVASLDIYIYRPSDAKTASFPTQ